MACNLTLAEPPGPPCSCTDSWKLYLLPTPRHVEGTLRYGPMMVRQEGGSADVLAVLQLYCALRGAVTEAPWSRRGSKAFTSTDPLLEGRCHGLSTKMLTGKGVGA
jgi:hypothetical protein